MKTKTAPVPDSTPTPTPQAPPATESKALRYYLYFTAAVTGAAVMIVEILGAKMLSPYVGMSHFVWTAQIAVTLIALATGYYAGGRLADRSQRLHWLYWAMLAAAAWLGLSVILCQGVANWALDFNLALGSLLASAVLFFLPLALLAMTGPFLVRVITSSVAGVGGNVGRLTSLSTLGSFAGTLLIGYFLLPHLPNSATMYFTALALTLVAAGYFVLFRRAPGTLLLVLLFSLGTGLSFHWRPQPNYRNVVENFSGNSHFGQLQVFDARDGSSRYYLNDNLIQNTYDPMQKTSQSVFTYMLSGLARAYTTNLHDALCIGLGVGIVPMDLARRGVQVDVVEINPAVVPVAKQFFGLEPDKLHITIDDGRHFLNRCQKQYDTVVLDAFLGDSSPSHLLTREAFASIRRVLRPGGTLVINSFAVLTPEGDFFTTSLNKTLKSVFPGVRMHDFTSGGAAFFVASDHPLTGFVHPPDFTGIHPLVHAETVATFAEVTEVRTDHGRVLTDDYNPVEFYDAHNREAFRRRLMNWTKDL